MHVFVNEIVLTYEHLSFTLCDSTAMFVSYFHRCVHKGSPKRHRGRRAEGLNVYLTAAWLTRTFNASF